MELDSPVLQKRSSGSRELCFDEMRFVDSSVKRVLFLQIFMVRLMLETFGLEVRRDDDQLPELHTVCYLRLCRRAVQPPLQWPPSSCGEHASILDVFNLLAKENIRKLKKKVLLEEVFTRQEVRKE